MSDPRFFFAPTVLPAFDPARAEAAPLAGGSLGVRDGVLTLVDGSGGGETLGAEQSASIHELGAAAAAFGDEAALRDAGLALAARVTAPRPPLLDLNFSRPRIMAVVNVTPDSFSDGGARLDPARAVADAQAMLAAGADILDIGGESTRPGAAPVGLQEELDRVAPVLEGLAAAGVVAPISIDTRKAAVARAAFGLGARLFNDVSALTHDADSLAAAVELTTETDGWLCLMHAQGDPATMQEKPHYEDVALEVALFLSERIEAAVAAGVPRDRILVDPGIGFGKTSAHNMTLIQRLGLLHSLGAPILLGVSRKRFIGALTGVAKAAERGPGSIGAGLVGLGQGAQILRVHDVAATAQAVAVWSALSLAGHDARAAAEKET